MPRNCPLFSIINFFSGLASPTPCPSRQVVGPSARYQRRQINDPLQLFVDPYGHSLPSVWRSPPRLTLPPKSASGKVLARR